MADVIVGRFALIDLIARGGSGAVWRAWDAKVQELCAAKVLRQRDSADLMRFVREKGVAFDHPHLLAPYGWGAEDEHVVIAMPLVSGGTLESVVREKGPLAEPAVVVILDQLLDGLAHMHALGWIHRDVKPANLMFEARPGWPHARLADFGIAVSDQDVRFTHVGMVNGTPGYMAPELFSHAEPHPSHDLYAAGILALFALNGPIPLRDAPLRADEVERYLRGASPRLAGVIRRLIDPQPERRFPDARAVRYELPRVPPRYALAHTSGEPLVLRDVLAPLPENAPGADVRAQRATATAAPALSRAEEVPLAEAARAVDVPEARRDAGSVTPTPRPALSSPTAAPTPRPTLGSPTAGPGTPAPRPALSSPAAAPAAGSHAASAPVAQQRSGPARATETFQHSTTPRYSAPAQQPATWQNGAAPQHRTPSQRSSEPHRQSSPVPVGGGNPSAPAPQPRISRQRAVTAGVVGGAAGVLVGVPLAVLLLVLI